MYVRADLCSFLISRRKKGAEHISYVIPEFLVIFAQLRTDISEILAFIAQRGIAQSKGDARRRIGSENAFSVLYQIFQSIFAPFVHAEIYAGRNFDLIDAYNNGKTFMK